MLKGLKKAKEISKKVTEEEYKRVVAEVKDIVVSDEEKANDAIMIGLADSLVEERKDWDKLDDNMKYMAFSNLQHLSAKYFTLYDVQIKGVKAEKEGE